MLAVVWLLLTPTGADLAGLWEPLDEDGNYTGGLVLFGPNRSYATVWNRGDRLYFGVWEKKGLAFRFNDWCLDHSDWTWRKPLYRSRPYVFLKAGKDLLLYIDGSELNITALRRK